MFEDGYFLRNAVFNDSKVGFRQISDRTITFVGDVDVNFDKIDVDVELEGGVLLRPDERYCKEKNENPNQTLHDFLCFHHSKIAWIHEPDKLRRFVIEPRV